MTAPAYFIASRLGRLLRYNNESPSNSTNREAAAMDSDDDDSGDDLMVMFRRPSPLEEPPIPRPPVAPLDHPLAQVTNLASSPSEKLRSVTGNKRGRTINTVTMLSARQLNLSGNGKFSRSEAAHMSMRYLPKDGPECIRSENSRLYVGQFSRDGAFFIAGYQVTPCSLRWLLGFFGVSQDKRINILDVENNWAVKKRVVARNLRWTITDTALSPDQRFLAYASITPVVHLVNVGKENAGIQSLANVTDIHEGLQLNTEDESCGIWSLKFSADGKELLAGANDNALYIYDLNSMQTTFRVDAHADEVNAIAFADESNHIIFSGSDDSTCKVWDRRCFTTKCAGQLVGHLGGVTFIDSRGDGRYFISNSKDQSIKLWDIRAMTSSSRRSRHKPPSYRWDYRYMAFPGRHRNDKHPDDTSIMTYKGHEVLRTLVRCYFSPSISTGQKYIYTGSHDGSVFIYDLVTGQVVERLKYHRTVVRDCSWHPWRPMLVTSCWDGVLAKWEHLHGEEPASGNKPRRGCPFQMFSDDEEF